MAAIELCVPKVVSATGNVKNNSGGVAGFYVNSTTAGTLILYDDASTGTTNPISGTITPAVGFHRFPAALANGLYAVVGGTINVTFFYV